MVFGIMGILYYLFFSMNELEKPLDHPIIYGWIGIWFPIVGVLIIYEYYTKDSIHLYKNSLLAILYSILYFFGFFLLPAIFGAEQGNEIIFIWVGLLLVFYFITIGALHWYFGFYIAIFNIIVLLLAIMGNTSGEINPIVWVSILNLLGINNIYMQWAIVITSASLGLLEKGFNIFDT